MAGQLPSDRAFIPSGAWVETFPRRQQTTNATTLVSGRMSAVAIWLEKGWEISTASFASQTNAAVAPTNQWVALYRPSMALLAVSADELATAWPASTVKAFNFPAATVARERGVHYLGLVVVAATVPSLPHGPNATVLGSIQPVLAAQGAAGLTIPSSAPNPLVLGTTQSVPYAYVS